MALSGSLTTNAYGGVRSLTLTWSATQSVSGNTSTINWTLSGSGSTANYNPWYMTGPTKVVIDGTQVHYSTSRIQLRSGTVVASGSRTIPHNSDGSKSITIRIEGAIYTTSVNCTAEQSFTLNPIPRGATITSAPNFTDEDTSILVKYSNPAGATMDLCIKSGDQSKILVAYRTVTGSSYAFALTQSERQTLQAYAAKNTATVAFVLRSQLSGNQFFSASTKTLTIANPAPTLNPTVIDGNSTTVALTGDSSKLVKYYSDAQVAFGATAVKSATIQSRKVTCGSKSLTADGTMQDVESGTFAFSVTDSRGNTTTKTVTQTLINYVKLTCDMGSGVPDATGKFVFRVSGNFFNASFGAVVNTLTVQYRYRVDGGVYSEYKAMTVSKSGNTYTATVTLTGLDYTKPHQFQAQAVDKLSTVATEEKTVRSIPVFDWSETDFNFNVPVSIRGGDATAERILYSGRTNGSITLGEDAAVFKYLEILFEDNNGVGGGYTRVLPKSGRFSLWLMEPSAYGRTYIRRTSYQLNGTTITPESDPAGGYVRLDSDGKISVNTAQNYVYITRVVGIT